MVVPWQRVERVRVWLLQKTLGTEVQGASRYVYRRRPSIPRVRVRVRARVRVRKGAG